MGVWLGPRSGKPEPIALYTAGDSNTFTGVEYKVAYSGSDGEATFPGAYYQEGYVDVALLNRYSSALQKYVDRSGLLVCGPVDLTKYKKIRFDYTNGQLRTKAVRFYASTSANSFVTDRDAWIEASNSSDSLELDVSGLSGTHYVGIAVLASGSGNTRTEMYITAITVTAD